MARVPERTSAVLTRIVAMAITAGVGMASFALSFAALRDLAVRGHIPADQAWLWPLVVDGTIMLATMGVIVMTAHPGHSAKRFFWSVLGVSAIVSILCNALHAILPADQPLSPWLTGALAAVAPAALLATTHGLTALTRLPPAGVPAGISATPPHTATPKAPTPAASAPTPSTPAPPASAPEVPAPSASARSERLTDEPRASARTPEVPAPSASARREPLTDEPVTRTAAVATVAVSLPAAEVSQRDNGPAVAGRRWLALAPHVLARASLREAGVEQVAQVLHMGFEDALTHREIGRRMRMSHHTVGKIQSVGSQLLAEQQHIAVAS